MLADDQKRWDLIHQKLGSEEAHSKYAQEVEQQFPRESIVVDLGGGSGADALYFLQKGHMVILMDISPYALNKAKEKIKNTKYADKLVLRQVDFGKDDFPIKSESVDVVYSRISLNYFGSNHTKKIFSDIYKILKPGGKAFISLKSPDDPDDMKFLEESASVYEPNVFIHNHQLRSRFTIDQLNKILRESGVKNFTINKYEEDLGHKVGGHKDFLLVNDIRIVK